MSLSKLDEKLRGQKIITGGATAPALMWSGSNFKPNVIPDMSHYTLINFS